MKKLFLCIGLLSLYLNAYSQTEPVTPYIESVDGDVYSPNFRFGVVLTSPDGTCYRLRVENGGTIISEPASCPGSSQVDVVSVVNTTITNTTSTSISIAVELNQGAALQLDYWPTSNPSNILSGQAETSSLYGIPTTDGGNGEHNQTLTNLLPGTEYLVQSKSSQDGGLSWYPIGSPTSMTTASLSGSWIEIAADEWQSGGGSDNATHSADWTGNNGFQPDNSATDAWRIRIPQNANYGASRIFENLPTNAQDVEFTYWVYLPINYRDFWKNSDNHMKWPGLAGQVSSLNGGNGGSHYTHLPQGYRAPSARLLFARPNNGAYSDALGTEMYHSGSINGGSSINPQGVPKYYGETKWAAPNGLASSAQKFPTGQWTQIHQRMVMNTPGLADGELHFEIVGVPGSGYSQTNVEWVKEFPEWQTFQNANPPKLQGWTSSREMFKIHRIWMNFYHGGGAKQSAGDLYLFARKFEYKVNR